MRPWTHGAALVVAAVVLLVGPAGAHAVLRSSDPADGASLSAPPAQVALDFTEDVVTLGTRVDVTVDGGAPVGGDPVVEAGRVVVPVDDGAPAGSYRVRWRATSADGHPVSGELTFDVTGSSATGMPTARADDGASGERPQAGGDGSPSGWLFAGLAAGALVAGGVGTGVLRRLRR